MKLNVENCIGCGVCAAVCPKQCISIQENKKGFFVPKIETTSCIDCDLCKKKCPVQEEHSATWDPKIFFALNRDTEVRFSSSSGGVFSEIAERVLREGGVCFGVDFECEDKQAKYVEIRSKDELYKLRKSKYVQANPNNILPQVKKCLEEKIPVLFSGTPCMVYALKTFLGKAYDNLITCDFICHGVPSAGVFKDYLCLLEKRYKSKVVSVDFRPKTYGWSKYSLRVGFENGKIYDKLMMLDPYFKAFMVDNIILNDGCYSCRYILTKYSDITLADFWGYQSINGELNDEKGLSLVFANTPRGLALFKQLEGIVAQEIPKESVAYIFNKQIYGKKMLAKQEAFFNEYTKEKFKKCLEKYTAHPNWKERVKYYIRKILR